MDGGSGDQGGHVGFGNAAVAMRSEGDEKRRVVDIDRIEMQAEREHPVEQRLGRSDMLDAGLRGPWAEARGFDATLHGDGAVLMPGERPIGCGCLVEQDRADRVGVGAEMGRYVAAYGAIGGEEKAQGRE